jgi:hypothetical protein
MKGRRLTRRLRKKKNDMTKRSIWRKKRTEVKLVTALFIPHGTRRKEKNEYSNSTSVDVETPLVQIVLYFQ